MSRFPSIVLLAAVALACEGSPVDLPSPVGVVPTPLPPLPPLAAVISVSSPQWIPIDFVGTTRNYWVEAIDAAGAPASVDGVVVSSGNQAVATIGSVELYSYLDGRSGRHYTKALATVLKTGVGRTEIRATLGGLTASELLDVRELPSARVEIQIDSFTVVEYDACTGACSTVLYAPLLWLTEPEGTSGEALEAIEVSLGPLTGWCSSSGTPLAAGETVRINERIAPYAYDNDFILMSLSGPVAETTATARVLVRNVVGELGVLEASAPIRRGAQVPLGPPPAKPCG